MAKIRVDYETPEERAAAIEARGDLYLISDNTHHDEQFLVFDDVAAKPPPEPETKGLARAIAALTARVKKLEDAGGGNPPGGGGSAAG